MPERVAVLAPMVSELRPVVKAFQLTAAPQTGDAKRHTGRVGTLDIIATMTTFERYWMVSFLIGYAVLLLYFILQAIEALHPGRFRPSLEGWPAGSADLPIGVRYYEDVIKRTAAEQWTAWSHVRLSQLNAELAVQLHSLALKNDAKHRAVRRLYIGLRAMAFVLGAVLAMYLLFSWT